MMTVHEALMAYKIGSWSNESVNSAQSINSLFKGYSELVEFSKVRDHEFSPNFVFSAE